MKRKPPRGYVSRMEFLKMLNRGSPYPAHPSLLSYYKRCGVTFDSVKIGRHVYYSTASLRSFYKDSHKGRYSVATVKEVGKIRRERARVEASGLTDTRNKSKVKWN